VQVVAFGMGRYLAPARAQLRDELEPQLNEAQFAVYDAVMTAVQDGSPFAAFLDGVAAQARLSRTMLYWLA